MARNGGKCILLMLDCQPLSQLPHGRGINAKLAFNIFSMKYYRVIWLTNKAKGIFCHGPLTHSEACIIFSKITKYPWRKEMLEEIK